MPYGARAFTTVLLKNIRGAEPHLDAHQAAFQHRIVSNGDILAASDENAMFAAKDRQPLNFDGFCVDDSDNRHIVWRN